MSENISSYVQCASCGQSEGSICHHVATTGFHRFRIKGELDCVTCANPSRLHCNLSSYAHIGSDCQFIHHAFIPPNVPRCSYLRGFSQVACGLPDFHDIHNPNKTIGAMEGHVFLPAEENTPEPEPEPEPVRCGLLMLVPVPMGNCQEPVPCRLHVKQEKPVRNNEIDDLTNQLAELRAETERKTKSIEQLCKSLESDRQTIDKMRTHLGKLVTSLNDLNNDLKIINLGFSLE